MLAGGNTYDEGQAKKWLALPILRIKFNYIELDRLNSLC